MGGFQSTKLGRSEKGVHQIKNLHIKRNNYHSQETIELEKIFANYSSDK
jgi:hypothetical protein